MDITKVCKLCLEMKPITDYYQNKKSGYYHSYCLPCETKKRQSYITNSNYVYKAKYLDKYPEEIQQYVRESIKKPDYDIKEISEHSGISKSTLSGWIKKNII